MRILFHPNVGAVFVHRFPAGSRVLKEKLRGGHTNWRSWFIGRWRIMLVKATPHWVGN